jgi:hypothetical protein
MCFGMIFFDKKKEARTRSEAAGSENNIWRGASEERPHQKYILIPMLWKCGKNRGTDTSANVSRSRILLLFYSTFFIFISFASSRRQEHKTLPASSHFDLRPTRRRRPSSFKSFSFPRLPFKTLHPSIHPPPPPQSLL